MKSQDSINKAKREAENLAKKERIIRETEVRVRKETEQRLVSVARQVISVNYANYSRLPNIYGVGKMENSISSGL